MKFRRRIIAENLRTRMELSYPETSPPMIGENDLVASSPNRCSSKCSLQLGLLTTAIGVAIFFVASVIVIFIYLAMKIVNRLTRSGTVQSPTEDLSIGIGAEPHRLCYMQTTGLDRKLIEAISVIPYIKGKGTVGGSECTVCLGEFQEGENLRILPRCNHAFHVSCIDTWLQSHANCPICRSVIVDPLENSSSLNFGS